MPNSSAPDGVTKATLAPLNRRTSFAYDAADRETLKTLANGSTARHDYDGAGRILRVANLRSDTTTISAFAYTYNCVGDRTRVIESDMSAVRWKYDRRRQLINERRFSGGWDTLTTDQWAALTVDEWSCLPAFSGGSPEYDTTYTYDPVGNRLRRTDSGARTTYSYDAANQLLLEVRPAGRTTDNYDSCGNRTVRDDSSAGTTYYAWDERHRLITAEPRRRRRAWLCRAGGIYPDTVDAGPGTRGGRAGIRTDQARCAPPQGFPLRSQR